MRLGLSLGFMTSVEDPVPLTTLLCSTRDPGTLRTMAELALS